MSTLISVQASQPLAYSFWYFFVAMHMLTHMQNNTGKTNQIITVFLLAGVRCGIEFNEERVIVARNWSTNRMWLNLLLLIYQLSAQEAQTRGGGYMAEHQLPLAAMCTSLFRVKPLNLCVQLVRVKDVALAPTSFSVTR